MGRVLRRIKRRRRALYVKPNGGRLVPLKRQTMDNLNQYKAENEKILNELRQKAANYAQLKSEILGKLQGTRNFLDGMDLELMGEYKAVKAAVASLPILEELERIIQRIEK